MSAIKRLCAWCGGDLGTVEWPDVDCGTTHGICPACATKMLSQFGVRPLASGRIDAATREVLITPVEVISGT